LLPILPVDRKKSIYFLGGVSKAFWPTLEKIFPSVRIYNTKLVKDPTINLLFHSIANNNVDLSQGEKNSGIYIDSR
jgi:hypothetical protein